MKVAIDALLPAVPLRQKGEEEGHIRTLAECRPGDLPPILVHRPTMRVIDGMHRLAAARRRGETEIDAVYFDGTAHEAFVLAVRENSAHGLPLSSADRTAAARRLVRQHPQFSDRAIASITGLAPRSVAAIRRRSTGDNAQLKVRIGRDGRARPLDASEGRRRAGELMRRSPDASLREIARAAGISLGTASDVRRRIRQGLSPVPGPASHTPAHATPDSPGKALTAGSPGTVRPLPLWRDPSLRLTEQGRTLLRLLQTQSISGEEWDRLLAGVPAHSAESVAEAARSCAEAWQEFARRVEYRRRPAHRPTG